MFKPLVAASILFATTATAQVADSAEAALRTIAERTVADQMTDPDSARFRWTSHPARPVGHMFIDCGQVNAKNRMGGYVGYQWFYVEIEDGTAIKSQVDSDGDDKAAKYCEPWAD